MDENKNDSQEPLSLSQEDLEALFESTFQEVAGNTVKVDQKEAPKPPLFDSSLKQKFSPVKESGHFANSESEKIKAGGEDRPAKSSLRIKYEAEVTSIKKSSGDLEAIRRQLGLSKRKMAQLLLVDPSAWTRWTSKEGEAPPHIYRALQWYLLLQEKHPEYKSSLWLNAVATPQLSGHEVENLKKILITKAQEEIERQNLQLLDHRLLEFNELEKDLNVSKRQILKLNSKMGKLVIAQACIIVFLLLLVVFK